MISCFNDNILYIYLEAILSMRLIYLSSFLYFLLSAFPALSQQPFATQQKHLKKTFKTEIIKPLVVANEELYSSFDYLKKN
ncbi:hypothetical protein DCO56_09020 [Sphingobacterium athyrii]|uniref:Uncharacterized protein n=1 Tax=Sphingobacterium athyrii TaxID=2152717 RepID=A0A363NWI1_9SPHI|nr:hypothetical protein DCO56_09020 [Sphingobacterium athyrii]